LKQLIDNLEGLRRALAPSPIGLIAGMRRRYRPQRPAPDTIWNFVPVERWMVRITACEQDLERESGLAQDGHLHTSDRRQVLPTFVRAQTQRGMCFICTSNPGRSWSIIETNCKQRPSALFQARTKQPPKYHRAIPSTGVQTCQQEHNFSYREPEEANPGIGRMVPSIQRVCELGVKPRKDLIRPRDSRIGQVDHDVYRYRRPAADPEPRC
jgi:hypothetical protein